jgi:hypothetical protein
MFKPGPPQPGVFDPELARSFRECRRDLRQ